MDLGSFEFDVGDLSLEHALRNLPRSAIHNPLNIPLIAYRRGERVVLEPAYSVCRASMVSLCAMVPGISNVRLDDSREDVCFTYARVPYQIVSP